LRVHDDPKGHPARFRVPQAYAGYRLDQFLRRMIPKLSRSKVQRAIDERVRLSWAAPVKASTPVREGGDVFVDDPDVNEPELDFHPPILFEDRDLLAIDKPPGLVVHPTHSHLRNTVITLLRRQRREPALTLLHRLDAETSGVLLIGRHRWAARRMQTSFERGRIRKRYLALVFGRPREDSFTVDVPLGTHSEDEFVFRQSSRSAQAKPCRTEIAVLERREKVSLVEARLITGRRHQIRAHLAEAGYPLVGDKLYRLTDREYRRYLTAGGLDEEHLARLLAPRCLLHAVGAELDHPRDRQRRLHIEAPMPEDMRGMLEAETA
jgi:23S rRNA pseudouridine1911/1915/1917 synthase